MKQILAITKLNLKLLWRHKIVHTMLILIPAVCLGAFFILSPDKDVVKDVQFRLLYGYTAAYSVLTLMAIFIGVYVTRSQLDAKNIHFVTSFPVSRLKIFIGQFLSNCILLFTTLLVLLITVFISYSSYISKFESQLDEEQRASLWKSRFEVKAIPPDLDALTKERLKKHNVKIEKINSQDWQLYLEFTRREEQRIRKDQKKIWSFPAIDLTKINSDKIDLYIKLNGRSSEEFVTAKIRVFDPQSENYIEKKKELIVKLPTYKLHKISLDKSLIPNNKSFKIEFIHQNKFELLVSNQSGIKFLFQDSSFMVNLFKTFASQLLHLPVLSALGMTAGICFSFSVAGLISMVTYLFSFADFFSKTLAYVDPDKLSKFEVISAIVLRYGIKITEGIQGAKSIDYLSQGISISFEASWFLSLIMNFVIFLVLSVYFFSKKELDKVQS